MRRNNIALFPAFDPAPTRHPIGDYNGKSWGVDATPIGGIEPLLPAQRGMAPRRFTLFAVGVTVIIALFNGRLVQLQLAHGGDLRAAAEENRIRLEPITASRGIIYDRHGTPLVRNVPNIAVQVIPADLPARDDEMQRLGASLAGLLGEPEEALGAELRALRAASFVPQPLRDQVPYDTARQIKLVEASLPGVRVVATATREYLRGAALSMVLGYTGKITKEMYDAEVEQPYQLTAQVGKEGIERQYERQLRGMDGKKQVEVNALGKERRVVASQPPQPGADLSLTIDADLQQRAQELLDGKVRDLGIPGGSLVAVDPQSGAVLALVSTPTFDSNAFVRGMEPDAYAALLADARQPLFHRAIAGQYPPGSTIKPSIAAAALAEKVITPTTTVLSTGGIRIGPWFFPDWRAGGHGVTDVRKAIADSVNTFFYTIGGGTETVTGLGVTRIAKYLQRFGFGSPLGIDLPGEEGGFVPTPEWKQRVKNERWYVGDTYHLAIGQGDLLVTPLQMASVTAAIANGGTLYQPHLVQRIGRPGATPSPIPQTVREQQLVDADSIQVVREAMRQTVTSGSAKAAQRVPVAVAGKTGTAQFGSEKRTNAWFTAFAPYDHPQIALAVILEAGGEGSTNALPVATELLQWYFREAGKP